MKQISLLVLFITLLGCKKEYTYVNNIEKDVVFLADDKLEGRSTGSEGENYVLFTVQKYCRRSTLCHLP